MFEGLMQDFAAFGGGEAAFRAVKVLGAEAPGRERLERAGRLHLEDASAAGGQPGRPGNGRHIDEFDRPNLVKRRARCPETGTKFFGSDRRQARAKKIGKQWRGARWALGVL